MYILFITLSVNPEQREDSQTIQLLKLITEYTENKNQKLYAQTYKNQQHSIL